MATFALVHGSGDGGWAWHLVQRALRRLGHEALAPDLPTDRDDATWTGCAEAVLQVLAGAEDPVLVGHSSGGFVVPLVADRLGGARQVHVAAMVPRPGETPAGWFDHVGWGEAVAEQARRDGGLSGDPDPAVTFFHDVPAALAARARAHERPTDGPLGATPWPLPGLPEGPTTYVVTDRDRFLPPPLQHRVAAERLGVTEPLRLATGHCPHLARPEELARMLHDWAARSAARAAG